MEKHLLSKSTFIRGNQCLKSLYLNKKRPFLRDRIPQERLLVFKRGHKVGDLAQQLFPGGINMSPGHPAAYRKAILNTQDKIREGFPVIYEAGFQHDQVMILLDILVHSAKGWHAYEVKSSGGISDTYLMDAALQYHVIKGTGLDLNGISLIHINKEYMLEDELDVHGLFKIVDITEEALSRQEYVAEQITREKEALGLDHSPKIDVGPHCREPYDCDFIGHCWKNIKAPAKNEENDQLNKQLIGNLSELNAETTAFVKLLPMRPALPMYKGTHPYQEIVYAYALQKNSGKDTGLFAPETNPMDKLAISLNEDLAGITSVLCFGQSYVLRTILPDNIELIDLKYLILTDSKFYTDLQDTSELDRLRVIFGLSDGIKIPEYTSDAIAEHNYLTKLEGDETKEKIQEYAVAWVEAIQGVFDFCRFAL